MEDKDMPEGVMDSQVEDEEGGKGRLFAPTCSPLFSPHLKAMIRIRNKYQALKKRRMDGSTLLRSTGPEIFTFDRMDGAEKPLRTKRKRRSRVLFPNDTRRYLPKNKDQSRAKPFLILFSVIVFLQVYNAIENLDDHIVRYDMEGLEKTLAREVFGQKGAMEELMEHLRDYLSTYVHHRPLALSLHGPSGVGKSHLGRLLARHFRSVVGEDLVVQFFTLHNCPKQESAERCAAELAGRVAEVVGRAEEEEKIPLFVLDEVELMQPPLLDVLHGLLQPNQTNEFLNAVYVLLSSLGQREITRHVLHNSSSSSSSSGGAGGQLGWEVQRVLAEQHPLWAEVEVVPLTLLERSHVMECFLDEMTREGFYPDLTHIERLAEELSYYTIAARQYSQSGCKQVVAKVNLL